MQLRPFSLRIILPIIFVGTILYFTVGGSTQVDYEKNIPLATSSLSLRSLATSSLPIVAVEPFVVTHLSPPTPIRGAYMTSCIASTPSLRAPLVKLLEATELNAVIIDIKDYTGMISFKSDDPRFVPNSKGCLVADMKEFIGSLHKKNIYVIGRVTVFQDQTFSKSNPDAAVKQKSNGQSWKDKKGLMFIDPGATEYWDHMVALAQVSYAIGFDEINFDYIRYPSDGNMTNASFTRSGSTTKSKMMKKFYSYLGGHMRDAKIPSSADLFGMTTTNTDDLGIGQILEDALQNFDYVAPMVYPSHYPPNFNGWKNPNNVPYEIINLVMSSAVKRANALEAKEAGFVLSTSTPKFTATGKYANRLRPWIQDFDYGKIYIEADVRAQKKGVYDSGLTSWMSWDPSNKYTSSAYNKEGKESSTPASAE